MDPRDPAHLFQIGLVLVGFYATVVFFLVLRNNWPTYDFPYEFDDGQCAICLNPHENKSQIYCGHVFCYECLNDWCQIKLECPTCKTPFSIFRHSIKSSLHFRISTPVAIIDSEEDDSSFSNESEPSSDNTPVTEDELFQQYFQSTADQILPPL
jgi:hypothetical protein